MARTSRSGQCEAGRAGASGRVRGVGRAGGRCVGGGVRGVGSGRRRQRGERGGPTSSLRYQPRAARAVSPGTREERRRADTREARRCADTRGERRPGLPRGVRPTLALGVRKVERGPVPRPPRIEPASRRQRICVCVCVRVRVDRKFTIHTHTQTHTHTHTHTHYREQERERVREREGEGEREGHWQGRGGVSCRGILVRTDRLHRV